MESIWGKFFLVGIGFLIGGVIGVVGVGMRLFPEHKVKSSKMLSIGFFILGFVFIALGLIKM